jgi:putative inorganic carbon (hco3(-)) transporter
MTATLTTPRRTRRAPVLAVEPTVARSAVTDIAILGFFAFFYGNVFVVASQFYGVPTAVASSAALLLALPFARRVILDGEPLVLTTTFGAVLLYLVAMLASAAASANTEATLPLVANFVMEGFVLYLLVSGAASTTTRCRQIMWVIVAAAVAMSALAVFQELTKSYDNSFGGFGQVSAGGFEVKEEGSLVGQLRPRLAGPIGEQNRFAQVLLVAAPFAFFGARATTSSRVRRAGYVSAAVIIGGVLVTYSRGAAVALGGLVLLLAVHRVVKLRHVAAMVLVTALAIAVVAPDYTVRLASLANVTAVNDPTSREADGAIRGRAGEVLAAWNTFTAHPIVGVGPGRYFREYSKIEANKLPFRHLDTERRAHNLYAEILADLGLIGFGAFVLANGITISLLVRARRRWAGIDTARESLAAGALFGLYAYLLTGFFLQLSYQRYYWALLALCNGVAWSLGPESERRRSLSRAVRGRGRERPETRQLA